MDPTPVPADGAADAGQLEAIPLNGIRLSSELLDGANGVFNGMHEGHSFAFAALFLTLALERAWHRRTPGQSEKQKSVRGRSGEDPDHLRFRPNTTSA